MNENINLCEILKDCPIGTKLYTPLAGEVHFKCVTEHDTYPIDTYIKEDLADRLSFTKEGLYHDLPNGECLLFPSKDVRTWEGWQCPKPKKPKFDPKTLQPFDKVLARNRKNSLWRCGLFSFVLDETCIYTDEPYCYCVPYNEDTKHLIGTSDEAPEFYRYWED